MANKLKERVKALLAVQLKNFFFCGFPYVVIIIISLNSLKDNFVRDPGPYISIKFLHGALYAPPPHCCGFLSITQNMLRQPIYENSWPIKSFCCLYEKKTK